MLEYLAGIADQYLSIQWSVRRMHCTDKCLHEHWVLVTWGDPYLFTLQAVFM